MPPDVQFWLLITAFAILLVGVGAQSYLLLRLMGDVEKFGRLLLKARRALKAQG